MSINFRQLSLETMDMEGAISLPQRLGLMPALPQGRKKTRYDITHLTESQHGKYGNLKNG